MKSLNTLMRKVTEELGDICCVNTDLDVKTIEARIEGEGWSFLTITLADFGKNFERSLELGSVAHDSFPGFRYRAGLPVFLRGFLGRVFDVKTGTLLGSPDEYSIWAVRQITLMWSKIKLETTEKRNRDALLGYIQCEQQVGQSTQALSVDFDKIEALRRMSDVLYGRIFNNLDQDLVFGDGFRPQHGPGATADKLRGNSKWNQSEWTQRLEEVFPHGDYLFNAWGHQHDDTCPVQLLEPGKERPVRIVTVPKTQKSPRIIAIEPTCMMYVQQGLLKMIQESIEKDDFLSNFIRFSDQIPNQEMAQAGSRKDPKPLYEGDTNMSRYRLATLDLSEASDRVSLLHVEELLAYHGPLRRAVLAARSSKARIEEFDREVELSKFASMGSALTFPMEMMVFLAVIFLGIEKAEGRQFQRRDVQSFAGLVAIYGDDIIVPEIHATYVIDELEAYGFKVNRHKSFWRGNFRESCGREYYDGFDVSITRIRRPFISDVGASPEGVISMVELRNQLYKAGLWSTVRWMDTVLEEVIPFQP